MPDYLQEFLLTLRGEWAEHIYACAGCSQTLHNYLGMNEPEYVHWFLTGQAPLWMQREWTAARAAAQPVSR